MDKRKSRERRAAKNQEPTRLQLVAKIFTDALRIVFSMLTIYKFFFHD